MGGLGSLLGSRGGARLVQKIDDAPESSKAVSSGARFFGSAVGTGDKQVLQIGATLGLRVGFGLGVWMGLQGVLKLAFANKVG